MLLTATTSNATLYAPFEKSKGSRIGVLKSHGVSRFNAVFLCAKSQFIYMSDWVEHSKEWLGRVSSTPTLLSSDSMIGVMLSGFKILHTEAIMPKYAQEHTKQNPLTIPVSTTKQNSLHKQVEIIGYSLDSFCLDSNTNTRATLKADALELVRMLNELDTVQHCVEPTHINTQERKTSLFNVLAKGTKRVIAYKIPFERAIQCHKKNQTVIKFAGMAGGVA